MTTSKGTGTSVQPAAEAETETETETETAPLAGRIAAPAGDPQQLEAEIGRTREQLGETVQELVARVHVTSRARAKAAEVSGRMKSTTAQARSQVASKTVATRQKVVSVGAGTSEQMRRAVTKGANSAREGWMPLTLAAGALIVGYLVGRQWSRRSPDARRCQRGTLRWPGPAK